MKFIPIQFPIFLSIFLFSLQAPTALFSQAGGPSPLVPPPSIAVISGKVLDAGTGFPLAYATVTLLSKQDSTPISGALTDEAGTFSFKAKPGDYFAKIDYLGYQTHIIPNISVNNGNTPIQLGTIALEPSATALNEVVVQAEKSSMQMTLDKKVFNVGKDLGNAGGNASDILSNIPSVQVGSDGAVSLRGSENVRILIDGKPSGLLTFKGADGLRQLQASMIDKIEIITNPSARYEAEGMGGIINIVLKKERSRGLNGAFDLTTGYPQNFAAGINLNYRTRKLNFFSGYSPNYRDTPNETSQYQELYNGDTTSITRQTSKNQRISWDHNFRFGADYFINPKNTLTTSFTYNYNKSTRISDLTYRDYLFAESNPTGITTRRQDEKEVEPNLEYALNYKKTFGRDGHELNAEFRYQNNYEDSDQLFTENYFQPNGTSSEPTLLQQSMNDETEKQYILQLDYIKPFAKEGKFEAGFRGSIRDLTNDFVVQEYIGDAWEPLPNLDNNFLYNEDILAAYLIFGNKVKKFSYQLGLRAEASDVTTLLVETNEVNPRQYANLFPSAHVTYELPGQNNVQVSYSRRIRRPNYWDLNPFFSYSDSRNYWSGNPNLNPEFTDAYEIGHIKYFDNASLSSALYYRYTTGKVERIRRVDAFGNSATRPENLSTENAFGAEFIGNFSPWKWWKMDGSLNFFRSIIEGESEGQSYFSDTYSWFSQLTNRFTLWKKTDLQVRGNYEAPRLTPQGSRKAVAFMDIGLSRDVFHNNGTLTLNISDVFNSRRWRNITEGDNFYTSGNWQRRPRQINLSLNYRLHQSKKKPSPNQGGGGEGGGDF
jgi:ferric enterobactin receptor